MKRISIENLKISCCGECPFFQREIHEDVKRGTVSHVHVCRLLHQGSGLYTQMGDNSKLNDRFDSLPDVCPLEDI